MLENPDGSYPWWEAWMYDRVVAPRIVALLPRMLPEIGVPGATIGRLDCFPAFIIRATKTLGA